MPPARPARRALTSAQASRFGAGAAVAGINNPLADVRSPFSGSWTTSRSPVSRTSPPIVVVFFARGLRGFDGFAGFAAPVGVEPGMGPSVASDSG